MKPLRIGLCSVLLLHSQSSATPLMPVAETRETPALPVGEATMTGEWFGVGANGRLLVTLQANGARGILAIAENQDGATVTKVYQTNGAVEDGRFSFGGPDEDVFLHGTAFKYPETGWGNGTLITAEAGAARRTVEVHFFHLRRDSWLRRMLRVRR